MWKYAQVKVKDIDDNDNELTDEYQVFEVYDLDNDGVYEAFSKPSLIDLESLKMAITDIERDGINTWFYENGDVKKATAYDSGIALESSEFKMVNPPNPTGC